MKPILYEEVGVELQEDIDYRLLRIREPLPIVEPPKVKTDALSYGGGYTCFFYTAFQCFARRVFITSEYQYYHILFNRYVYTVDGRSFVGLYDPKFPDMINDSPYDPDDNNPDNNYCVPCVLYNIIYNNGN